MTNFRIHQEIEFDASPSRIYSALTNASEFSKMSGGAPAEIDANVGGAFSYFGGMVSGINVEMAPGERLVQAWRAGSWDAGVYSIARFELKPEGNGTRLVFDHAGYPEAEEKHLEDGWHSNYWEPLRNLSSS